MFLKVYKARVWLMLLMVLPFIGHAQLPGLPAGWQFTLNPNSATIAIPLSVTFNGVNALQPNDWVGAFFNDNGTLKCAGAVKWTGTGNVAIVVFGNDNLEPVKNGFYENEPINWKFYRTATGTEECVKAYNGLGTEFNYVTGFIGAIASFGPCAQPPVQLVLNLNSGWNWISFNVLPAGGNDLNTVLGDTGYQDGDFIQTVGAVAEFFEGYGWFGDLEFISPDLMYQLYIQSPKVLIVTGQPVEVSVPITLNAGWNWVGYKPQVPLEINYAFTSPSFVEGDFIQTVGAVAEYFEGYGWFGDLEYMFPGVGYQVFVANPGTVTYPASMALFGDSPVKRSNPTSFRKNEIDFASEDPTRAVNICGTVSNSLTGEPIAGAFVQAVTTNTTYGNPNWPAPAAFPFYQTNRYRVFLNGVSIDAAGSVLTAWNMGSTPTYQLRGRAFVQQPPVGPRQFQIQMGSLTSAGDVLTFKIYNGATNLVHDILETHTFTSGVNQGTATNPLSLTAIANPVTYNATTLSNGTYCINGVPENYYNFTVNADGYQGQQILNVLITTNYTQNFSLTPLVTCQNAVIQNFPTSLPDRCVGSYTIDFSGVVTQNGTPYWSVSPVQAGSFVGTLFNGSPDYTGPVTINLFVDAEDPCLDASASVSFTVVPSPTVNAGADQQICVGQVVTLAASATNYTSVQWVTNGTGYFANPNSLLTTYTPSTADYAAGSVELCVQVSGIAPCSGASDCLTVTFIQLPQPPVCPPDITVCINETPFTYGGYLINPGQLGEGTWPFVITNTNECGSASCTFYVTVLPLPQTPVCPPNISVCINSTPFNYGGYLINPGQLGEGTWPFVITNTNQCGSASCTFYVTVFPLPVVTCPSNFAVIINVPPFALTGAQPAGGTYSGTGVVNGVFNPQAAGLGNHIITYTYTDSNGCTNSCQFTITVEPVPAPSICGVVNDAITGAPIAGAFIQAITGTAIYGNPNWPAPAAFPFYQTNRYRVFVQGNPITTMGSVLTAWREASQPQYVLRGRAFLQQPPVGPRQFQIQMGSLTSSGDVLTFKVYDAGTNQVHDILETHTFTSGVNQGTPSNPLSLTALVNQIIYETYTGPDGSYCINNVQEGTYQISASASGYNPASVSGVQVTGPTIQNFNLMPLCQNAVIQNFPTSLPDVCQGSYTISFASVVTANGTPYWTVTPPAAGTFQVATKVFEGNPNYYGPVTITLFVDAVAPCLDATASVSFTVVGLPSVNAGPDQEVCVNSPVYLNASATNYSSVQWITLNGLGSFENENSLVTTYIPSALDYLLGSVELCVTVGAIDPCTTGASDCLIVTFIPLPVAECPDDVEVCINAEPFEYGGYLINPAQLGVGTWPFEISVSNQCGTDVCTFYVTVLPLPEPPVCPENIAVCIDAEPFEYGGYLIHPMQLGVGVHEFTRYNQNECGVTTCSFFVTVNPLPEVTCPENISVYINAEPFILTGGSPEGGYYMGPGILGANIFVPVLAGVGVHEITYLYTDGNGCSNSCTFTITVMEEIVVPQLTFANLQWPPSAQICLDQFYPVTVYGQVMIENGVLTPNGWEGLTVEFGVNNENTNPATWTMWYPAMGFQMSPFGIGPEYFGLIGFGLAPGTYYYAVKYTFNGVSYYGGYSPAGGGFWDGEVNVSGVLNVIETCVPLPCSIEWANLQWPPYGQITVGDPYVVYAQVYSANYPAQPIPGLQAWIGFSTENVHPSQFTNWVPAVFNVFVGNNSEYMANLGAAITEPGTYYYASRFQCPDGDFVYGGLGGFWNNDSGVLIVLPMEGCEVTCPQNMFVCINDEPFTLTGALPEGGMYSGTGVIDNVFYPEIAGEGEFLITYTYICENNEVGTCEFLITVLGLVTVECPEDQVLCYNDEPFVFGNFVFDPSQYTPGDYTFTFYNQGPCNIAECSFTITVLGPVTVECPEDQVLCYNDEPFVFGEFVFDPAEHEPGVYEFTFTEEGPCNVAECSFTITVLGPVTVECPEDQVLCYNDEPFVFGNFVFDPSQYTPGDYTFTFYNQGPCNIAECSFTITVLGPVTVECPEDQVLCFNDEPFVFGEFVFDPAEHEPGVYEFTFTEEGPCNVAECSFTITVLGPVTVECPEDFSICQNAEPFVWGDFVFDPSQYTPGDYTFTLYNQGPCNIAECSFTITVIEAPVIIEQPVDVSVLYGMDAQFSVVALNAYSYQWYGPNGLIPGANGPVLLLQGVTLADQGGYYVEIEDTCGEGVITSNVAYLTVLPWTQVINLPGPVNGASTYLNLINDDIATVFAPIMSSLQYVEFYQPNQTYVPGAISFPFTEHRGAKVGLKQNQWPKTLTVTGYPTLGTVVNLPAGWSIMPVWSQGVVLASDIFNQLGSNFKMAISIDYSGVYWPQYGIYTLNFLVPGNAYLVSLTAPGSVNFNVSTVKANVGYVSLPANKTSWKDVQMTGVQHVIAITTDALANLKVGDVIGAFNQNGEIAGMLEVTSLTENLAMRVYGKDFADNSMFGFSEGDQMTFKVYRNGEIIDLIATFDQNMPNTNIFAENGTSAIIDLKASTAAINNLTNDVVVNVYPNPARSFVNIETNFEIRNIKVVNYVGQVVFDQNINQMSLQINTSDLGPGVYFIQIQNNDGVVITRRLTVN